MRLAQAWARSNLLRRVITAALLLGMLVPAAWAENPRGLQLLMLLMMGGAMWEWASLNGVSQSFAAVYAAAMLLIGFMALLVDLPPRVWPSLWPGMSALWVGLFCFLLYGGVALWQRLIRPLRLTLGFVLLFVAWLAVVQLHAIGFNLLLSVAVLVFATDVGGYIGGRRWGGQLFRRKLAASISPGKTWEGVLGGMIALALVAGLWLWFDGRFEVASPSIFSAIAQKFGLFSIPVLLGLMAGAVCGDLIESLIKRSAGVKDSSRFLPGHGGVLDRMDALLPTLVLAMSIVTWRGGR